MNMIKRNLLCSLHNDFPLAKIELWMKLIRVMVEIEMTNFCWKKPIIRTEKLKNVSISLL